MVKRRAGGFTYVSLLHLVNMTTNIHVAEQSYAHLVTKHTAMHKKLHINQLETTFEMNHKCKCCALGLRPGFNNQQLKLTVLTHEVAWSTEGAGKAFAHAQ